MIDNDREEINGAGKTQTFKFRMTKTLADRLRAESTRSGLAAAEIIRRGADSYLREREDKATAEKREALPVLVEKWKSLGILPEDASGQRYQAIATLLENQDRQFTWSEGDCSGNPTVAAGLENMLGDDYRTIIYKAICRALETADIFDVCSVQPLTAPIGGVTYFQETTNDAEPDESASTIPTISLNLELMPTMAKHSRGRSVTLGESAETTIASALIEVVESVKHRLFGKCMVGPREPIEVAKDGNIHRSLLTAMKTIHERTHRGMANVAVCYPTEMARLDKLPGLRIVTDPLFPRDRILLMRFGSLLDTHAVWAPYVFTFHPQENEVAIGIRDSVEVVGYSGIDVINFV